MRLRGRDTSALAVGSVVSGLLAYVFFATTTRALGPEAAAPVSVLWTYWSFSAAALTFPAQHWIARTVALHHDESDVRSALPRLSCILLLVALVVGLLSWLARDELFHRDGLAFPALMAGVTLGSGVLGLSRGTLTGRRRFGSVATALVAEHTLRCLSAGLLVLGGVKDPVAYGVALLVGHLVVVMWPSSLRLGPLTDRVRNRASALRFLSGASGGQLLAQVALTGGPVVLALGGGTAVEVTALFAGLALF
ncbi:MAG: oligosaccharide flippase family protein, partial [Actinomycetota bacterium]|nr:oligosaccharide flippase family protein [Actinomycetota bacterium]